MNATEIASFLGWCTVLNAALLLFSMAILVTAREPIVKLHSRMFAIDPADLPKAYIRYLGQYKALVIVFNLVPYLALSIMGSA